VKRALAGGLLALSLAGCGAHKHEAEARFGALRVTGTGHIALKTTPRPHSEGPRTNLADVAFVSRRRGFVAISRPAIVQRTDDGGDTWHDRFRGRRGSELEWLARAPAGMVYAGGASYGRPLAALSRDGGGTWRAVRPRVTGIADDAWPFLRATFVTRDFGFTVPDPAAYGMGAFAVTRDGGRSWSAVPVPSGATGMQFLDARRGFAVGSIPRSCAGAAWRTTDGGASWARLFCGSVPLESVQFLDPRRGFVAGGWPAISEEAPSGVVYATSDGGRTWRRRYANPRRGYRRGIYPIVLLRFVDPLRGWARTGECKVGASGPCAGEILVTRDGGRSWQRRGVGVDLSTIGASDAWMLPPCDVDCATVSRTHDAGRTWTPLADPANADVFGVDTAGGLVSLHTDIARFVGGAQGRWRLGRKDVLGAAPGFAVLPRSAPVGAVSAAVAGRRTAFALVEPPGLELVRCGLGATMRILVTRDHGRSWRRTGSFRAVSVAADGSRVFATAQRQNCANVLASSGDAGRSWTLQALPRRNCAVSLWRRSVWLRCGRALLVSRDAGGSWLRLRGPKRFAGADVAADSGGAWLALGGHLWRTDDGGRTWIARWPRLPTP
jgi:photosystem II stability/assembly factor-like uncharacterized protein